ncbi:MAG: NAD(P)/FAD-dependent oxidoreductase [Herminiimonas sp.]|nr:NAD(P)/FAD-dependent oxidoreductase [Herminiimonas sp.]
MQSTGRALPHRIVIVGGGAGGLELAVRTGNALGRRNEADITLIDAARTHVWKPLLHQVAAGTLDTHADELEYFAVARNNHFRFRLGRMDGLDRAARQIHLSPTFDETGEEVMPRQSIGYDTLVVALGSQANDFNTPGARENAIMLDTPAEAERFHQRIINSCLRAQAVDAAARKPLMVAIIGGGATGVELSAELHMMNRILANYGLSNGVPGNDLKIAIIDAAPRLLPALPERLSDSVTHELNVLGIDVHVSEKVVEVSREGVRMASGVFIPASIVVWAAGIKAPDFLHDIAGLETTRNNQLVVNHCLQTSRDPTIFALGDCAACPQEAGQPLVPPRAQAAHQQATLLAKSLVRQLRGKTLLPFRYRDHGSLVSLGNYSTVGSLMGALASGSVFIEGKIAKLMYWSLHKQHQLAVTGVLRTILAVCAETIDAVRNPRIKLH